MAMLTSLNAGALALTLPLDQALVLAQANGFAALDLPLDELRTLADRTSVQEVKDRFDAAGVRPGPWGLPLDFRRDDTAYRAGLAALPRDAALAQALDSPWCSTWILPYSDELDYATNLARHAARLRPVAQILADHGCRLGLEFVGPRTMRAGHTHPFIATLEGALDLAERIATGNVGLLLDAFHWYTSHATLADVARLDAAQIVSVHLNDAVAGRDADEQIDRERDLPGATGVIDLVGFLQVVDRTGFDGPVAVEPFSAALSAMEPSERVRLAGQSLARLWAQAGLRA